MVHYCLNLPSPQRKALKLLMWSGALIRCWQQIKHEAESSVAPEICVEVLSSANTAAEMLKKRRLYFRHGAEEVWICNQDGMMQFFIAAGEIVHSHLVSAFLKRIDV